MEIRSSGKSVPALVCGILSLFMPFIGLTLGILGIVFGALARGEIRRSNHKLTGEGMAIAGIICGIAGIVKDVLIIILLYLFFGSVIEPLFFDTLRSA